MKKVNPDLSKKHLTKSEKAAKQQGLILTGNDLKKPDLIKNDFSANWKWNDIVREFKDKKVFCSSDSDLLAIYCMAYSEYLELQELKESADGISSHTTLQRSINAKMEILLKLQKELFLTPASRMTMLKIGKKLDELTLPEIEELHAKAKAGVATDYSLEALTERRKQLDSAFAMGYEL